MSKASSKDNKSTALRALDCLEEVALEKGLDGRSMRDVPLRLGSSVAALQYHYPTKNRLIEAFIAAAVDEYRASIQELLATQSDKPCLESLVRATLEVEPNSPGMRLIALIEARAQHDEATARTIEQAMPFYVKMLRDVIEAEYPDLPPGASVIAAALVVSVLEGAPAVMQAATALGAEPEALLQATVDAAMAIPQRLMGKPSG